MNMDLLLARLSRLKSGITRKNPATPTERPSPRFASPFDPPQSNQGSWLSLKPGLFSSHSPPVRISSRFLSLLTLWAAIAAAWLGVRNHFPSPCYGEPNLNGQACAVDGDTIRLGGRLNGRRCTDGHLIRLWGINAPESGTPEYRQSRSALQILLETHPVICQPIALDAYQRRVARCCAAKIDLGFAQVRAGWAWDYPKYSKGVYVEAEAKARQEGIGMWQAGK